MAVHGIHRDPLICKAYHAVGVGRTLRRTRCHLRTEGPQTRPWCRAAVDREAKNGQGGSFRDALYLTFLCHCAVILLALPP